MGLTSRFYTTYRLLPVINESVVVVAGPGFGAFYDESDPAFEKPENKKKMTIIRQGRRDTLFLDSIFKVPPFPCPPSLSISPFESSSIPTLASYGIVVLIPGILNPQSKYHVPSHSP